MALAIGCGPGQTLAILVELSSAHVAGYQVCIHFKEVDCLRRGLLCSWEGRRQEGGRRM